MSEAYTNNRNIVEDADCRMDYLKGYLNNGTGSASGTIARLFATVFAAVWDGYDLYDFPIKQGFG